MADVKTRPVSTPGWGPGYLKVASHPDFYGFWQNSAPADENGNLIADHPINATMHPLTNQPWPMPWGIEADFARAIAAAIFGWQNAFKIQWVPTDSTDRFVKLYDKFVDVSIRTCTNTTDRDTAIAFTSAVEGSVEAGFEFMPTYFYDGANVLLSEGAPATANIAVAAPTTSSEVLEAAIQRFGLSWNVVSVGASTVDAKNAWATGTYNGTPIHGFCTDTSGLIAAALEFPDVPASLYFANPLSKEPLAAFTREDDPHWSDLVRWVFYVLLEAEERGITQANVNDAANADFGKFTIQNNSGKYTYQVLGLGPEWAKDIIRAVGNYGEIYERNLWEDAWYIFKQVPPVNASPNARPRWTTQKTRGANDIWTNGGLLYSPAFR